MVLADRLDVVLFDQDKAPFAGDFAEVYPRLTDIDPCRSNLTPGLALEKARLLDEVESYALEMADRVAEAAEVGQRYINAATNPTWSLMVRIRQACAEGRIDDAEQLYEEFDFSPFDPASNNIQWLALKTLGRNDEAVELLRPLDRPETLVRLGELLSYTHFDPSPFPNLSRRLEEQGIMRREIEPMNFACER